MLTTIGSALPSETTLGDIIDASTTLGWTEGVGDLRLIDLAEALLQEPAAEPPREVVPLAAVVAEPPARAKASKPAAKKASKPAKAAASKPAKAKTQAPPSEAFDERMSLAEAIDAFVPLVRQLGEATMQDLEQATGLGRRKLRFHVGQLVKHGHLSRHGMGRGTFYSV